MQEYGIEDGAEISQEALRKLHRKKMKKIIKHGHKVAHAKYFGELV